MSSKKQKHVECYLEDGISKGVWKEHERIPAERALAAELGVSRNTLRTAIQALCGKGLLVSRKNSGTYVVGGVDSGRSSRQVLNDKIMGFSFFFPQVAALAVENISPAELCVLESFFSPLGLAVARGCGKEFCKMQQDFIRFVTAATHNSQIISAMLHLIPEGRVFYTLANKLTCEERGHVFAYLASVLGCIRRVDIDGAILQAEHYTSALKELVTLD